MKRMCNLNSVRKLTAIAVLASFALVGSTTTYAGKKDTPADVVRAGKDATEGLRTMAAALKNAQAIAARLQRPEVAARVLQLAQGNDLQGLTDLLKAAAPSSKIKVKSVGDITIIIEVFIGSKSYQLCIGNCEHPSGAKGGVVFQES